MSMNNNQKDIPIQIDYNYTRQKYITEKKKKKKLLWEIKEVGVWE